MSGVQECLLEVTVVKCRANFSHHLQEDPYVCLEYGSNIYHTRTTSKDGGDQGLVFQEKLVLTLYETSKEIIISVYNNNSFRKDDFIGRGRVQLQRVISQGYDDTTWPIFGESGMTTGEVCLMLCCPNMYLPNPYYRIIRGLKRPFLVENYVENEEEMGRDPMRKKLAMEANVGNLQPAEILDIAMEELVDKTSPTNLDEDTEMGYGSQLPTNQYSRMWDTICF